MYYFVSGRDSMATIGKKVATIEDALKTGRNMIESHTLTFFSLRASITFFLILCLYDRVRSWVNTTKHRLN
jgi:hypothetical protein